ncbi:sulfate transporter [Mycolicibacterium vanbaalenii]|nr:sulfate transporter [Mycolicibacterium vanbaalenii]
MVDRTHVHVSASRSLDGCAMLVLSGTLDSWTYREVRNSVIKAALDEPKAVVVDVSDLHVPASSAWTAFTSARWHVSTWPDVPIVLVCAQEERRAAIQRSGASRWVPVPPDEASAAASIGEPHRLRRRARDELAADRSSLTRARGLVARWLTEWACPDLILAASTVATVLIENVLEHTASRPILVLEAFDGCVTVAVSDQSPTPAALHESSGSGAHTVSGLAIVATLSRSWGSIPTANGKTVWTVLGPESRL